MSGLAATRLVKENPEGRTQNMVGDSFLRKKTKHAAYLFQNLFSVLSIAMSQLSVLRPENPFLWLGVYLLRHSGLCETIELSDGRVIVCSTTAVEDSLMEGGTQKNTRNKPKEHQNEDQMQCVTTRCKDSNSKYSENKVNAVVVVQANFRRHIAQEKYKKKLMQRDRDNHFQQMQRLRSNQFKTNIVSEPRFAYPFLKTLFMELVYISLYNTFNALYKVLTLNFE